ncbi:hypothetical protein KKG41_02815 [Patescibacteria group bacterium]|nr:hypothetical protein [Patescibacteria group bacterium]MBU1890068.1 hypothetical protein [Patescibacteria group bacterium]
MSRGGHDWMRKYCKYLDRLRQVLDECWSLFGGGEFNTATLSPCGQMTCQRMKLGYRSLFGMLEGRFGGEVTPYSSSFPGAMLTCWETTRKQAINPDKRLDRELSLWAIDGGKWLNNKPRGSFCDELYTAHTERGILLADQPYEKRMRLMREFVCSDFATERLKIGFGHEPELSLLMLSKGWVSPNEVGLYACECFIIFFDARGKVIQTDRICPTRQEFTEDSSLDCLTFPRIKLLTN